MKLIMDVETTKIPHHLPWIPGSYLVSVSCTDLSGKAKSWLFNHDEGTISQRQVITEIQAAVNSASLLIGHNLKFDLHWLKHIGIDFSNTPVFCTMVAEYVLKRHSNLGLRLNDAASSRGFGVKDDKVKLYWDSGYETDEVPAYVLNNYCERDCKLTGKVFLSQVEQIKKQNLVQIIKVENEVMRDLMLLEHNGMPIDANRLNNFDNEYILKIDKCEKEIQQISPFEVNLDSNDQLSCLLYGGTYKIDGTETVTKTLKSGEIKTYTRKAVFEKYSEGVGFKPLENTEAKKAGYWSTAVPILKQLKCKTKEQKRLIELLLERSKLAKMKSTYFDGFKTRMIADDNGGHYLYPTMNQCVTRTGRLSSSNPNGTNLPRGATGPVKKCIVSRYA